MKELPNIHINYKVLAKHFSISNEAMRVNYKKFKENNKGLWLIYVKAYNFDNGVKK